jgi:hypothetical protein
MKHTSFIGAGETTNVTAHIIATKKYLPLFTFQLLPFCGAAGTNQVAPMPYNPKHKN